MKLFNARSNYLLKARRLGVIAALAGVAAIEGAYGCAGEDELEAFIEENVGEVSEALVDDDSDTGTGTSCPAEPACNAGITVNTTPSLVVTRQSHASLLDTHFSLTAVLDRILAQSNVGAQTATNLFQRLWETQNSSTNAKFSESFQPHCNDNGQTINGFPVDCRTAEAALRNGAPSQFIPVALFNRFDLAPTDGSHCGEYRIVYALSGGPGRNLVIFEAQLPNPNPSCGIEACRPVADFWKSLSSISNSTTLGNELKNFYFTGLSGFRPVIHPQNYGLSAPSSGFYGSSGGQIRTNQFMQSSWQLREFQLDRACVGSTCTLFAKPVSVKNNPFPDLFDPTSTHALADDYQLDFVASGPAAPSNVQTLAASSLASIGMSTDGNFNAGQSTSQGSFDNYVSQFQTGGASSQFAANIQTQLTSIGSSLTPANIVARAMTQSCAGCHQHSNGASLGGGLTWPSSLTFVHVDENGSLSSALTSAFLPHRKGVLENFLRNCGPGAVAGGGAAMEAMGGESDAVSDAVSDAPASGTLGGSTTH